MFTVTNEWNKGQTLMVGLFDEKEKKREVFRKIESLFGVDLRTYMETDDLSSHKNHIEKVLIPKNEGLVRIYFLGLGSSQNLGENNYRKMIGRLFKKNRF
ncbi:M17 family peptidase N-terminal domain-containing protein [Halobacillus karajensis]|uniref:Peptidase M17 leucyl aminopeptidase N-terminal domain-containing protein n=1 Tax=Halobacillus karajensis TaxID=195088 RepID=A0A024P9K5_9BACI|nr:M17 family peptidase N-terminal domain-containing protein [Halobacillus karajensis]CDQ21305.1 hypothetical protein BN982_03672 [Halobacillus karajensis]CDQ25625.1 hypothetical protein BN983_03981 [Halobacillus karajensis]CDQ25896.1 hypothetical protein BN981_00102 [Halobacillus karajensis]